MCVEQLVFKKNDTMKTDLEVLKKSYNKYSDKSGKKAISLNLKIQAYEALVRLSNQYID